MTELAVREETPSAVALTSDIDSWTEIVAKIIRLANEIYDTPFVPDGLRGSAPAVAAAMLAGREMGLGPMTSLANIDVIRGKPTQKPLLMRAMILSHGHKWDDVENNDTRAVVRGCRKGESTWTTVTFTADQARKAGLDLGKYPADKLYARASSRLAKHRFADVIMGMASSDDAEDGVDVEVSVSAGEAPAAIAAAPEPARRTARRRGINERPQTASPAEQPAPAAPPAPPAESAGEALPPLPGEDEPDPTPGPQPGTGSSPSASATGEPAVNDLQLKAIWTVLNGAYGFTKDEKDQARAVCAHIVGRELASSKDLTKAEARTVLDTLANWRQAADGQGIEPRAYLVGLMAAEAGSDG